MRRRFLLLKHSRKNNPALASVRADLCVCPGAAEVRQIVLTEWKAENSTFYAAIVVESHGATHRIDARPSDALALAVRKQAPIFAEEALLEMDAKAKPKRGAKAKFVTMPPLATLWPVANGSSSKPKKKQSKKATKRA